MSDPMCGYIRRKGIMAIACDQADAIRLSVQCKQLRACLGQLQEMKVLIC